MSQTVVLIDNGSAEVIQLDVRADSGETALNVSKMDYEECNAQVWGGMEAGGKGVRISYCLGEMPETQLLEACFSDTVWLHFHLTDAVDSVIAGLNEGGWTKASVRLLATQFDEFASRLRSAAK